MRDWWASRDEQILLLNLSKIQGIGHVKLRILLGHFRNPSAIVKASLAELTKISGISHNTALNIKDANCDEYGENQFQRAEEHGCQILNLWSLSYPEKLRTIADPPIFLFIKGQADALNSFSVAVVGTRRPTAYGKNITLKITTELVDAGVTIVSGLARGIDTVSHAETCKMGGRTIAVLGSGLDVVYPPENKKLVEMICEKGAVVTELAFGAKPDAMNFPRRNRIISGLTCGTVVTEAGLKSGALITAYQALEQNREVFAVPGSIFSQQHAGSNKLIREGAKLVATVEDVLEELPAQGELFGKMDNGISTIKLSKDERSIVDVLRNGELHVDKISEILHTQTANVLSTLLKLELAGIVQQQPGKNFVLKKRI